MDPKGSLVRIFYTVIQQFKTWFRVKRAIKRTYKQNLVVVELPTVFWSNYIVLTSKLNNFTFQFPKQNFNYQINVIFSVYCSIFLADCGAVLQSWLYKVNTYFYSALCFLIVPSVQVNFAKFRAELKIIFEEYIPTKEVSCIVLLCVLFL